MPDKYDLAAYLVNLNTLLNAQESNGQAKSRVLAEDYERTWNELKSVIEKEKRK